jgi:hypothetical protein
MAIRPIITYTTILWWPRVEYKNRRATLSKLQMLACLGITGVKKTASTAAVEVLLGLPLVHLKIEAEAQAGMYRLSFDEQ